MNYAGRDAYLVLHPSDENYGADTVLREIVRFLRQEHEIEVWLPNDVVYPKRLLSKELEAQGIQVRRTEVPVLRRANLGLRGLMTTVKRMAGLYRAIRSCNCSIVYLNTSAVLVGGLCARAAGRRAVLHQHEIWSRTDRIMLGWMMAFVHTVVAPSEAVVKSLPRWCRDRARVVPNSTDERNASRAEPGAQIRFLMASRWHPGKGYAEFLKAWEAADLPDAELIILGGPPPSGTGFPVREVVANLRNAGSVRTVGEVDSITEHVESCDVMVIPSVRPESFGLLAVEAMAAGKAVLATDAGGLSEIVAPEWGWLLPPDDPAAWPDILRHINRTEAARRGAVGHRRFQERYTHQHFTQELGRVLEGAR